MITDPLFFAAAIPAILIVGLSKGGFMGGMVVVGVPLLSLRVPPVQAAAILLPVLLVMDAVSVWAYRHSFDPKNLSIMLPGAVLGIFIGWLTASYVSEGHVRLIVGVLAFLFTLDYWLGLRPQAEASSASLIKGGLSGTVAGFTSFVSHAGSPPLQIYLLPQRLERRLFAGTVAMFFAAANLIKVLPYFLLGQFDTRNLLTTAVLLPLAPIATAIGVYLVHRVRQEPFYRIAYACLLLVSLKLIWDGWHSVVGA